MSKKMQDVSQYFEEPTEVIVRIRQKDHKFLFHEISKEDADDLYRPVREMSKEAKSDEVALNAANEMVVKVAIEKIVSNAEGEFFTADQVPKLPIVLLNKLGGKVLAFMTGGNISTAGEENPKDESGDIAEDPQAPKA